MLRVNLTDEFGLVARVCFVYFFTMFDISFLLEWAMCNAIRNIIHVQECIARR